MRTFWSMGGGGGGGAGSAPPPFDPPLLAEGKELFHTQQSN